jgi:hypothetical protein
MYETDENGCTGGVGVITDVRGGGGGSFGTGGRSRSDRSFVGSELREECFECNDPPLVHSFEGAGVYDEVERSLVRRSASPLSKKSEWARKEEGVA